MNIRGVHPVEALESRTLLADVRFAVIGDFGADSSAEADVATLVKSWAPQLILTVGDNNYPIGAADTIDANVGKYFHEFIYPYSGTYGAGPADHVNHFFPVLGNHDWYTADAQPSFDFFTLPGNERYYTFTEGPVQFFAIDSDPRDADLNYIDTLASTADSTQGLWLQQQLAASTAQWKIVYLHHAPFSSGNHHGSSVWMRWPFRQWGATAVLSGHEHNYERLILDGLPYFVNGSGGRSLYGFSTPLEGSAVRFSDDYGAMLVDAGDTQIRFQFVTRGGEVIDDYTIPAIPTRPLRPAATAISPADISITWQDPGPVESSLEIQRSFDGITFTALATVPANTTRYRDRALAADTAYFYRVRAVNSAGQSRWSRTISAKTRRAASPPAPWSSAQIGSTPLGGSAMHYRGLFTLKAGPGIDDSWWLTSQALDGDGSIVARVRSATLSGWTAGLMFRGSYRPGAIHAAALFSSDSTASFVSRPVYSGSVDSLSMPFDRQNWLKLTRVGNLITAWASPDARHWTALGQRTIPFRRFVQVGLAARSLTPSARATITFDHVTIAT